MIDSTNPNYITPFTLWGEVKYSSSTSLLPPLQDKLFSRNWHIWIWLDDLKHELMFYVTRRQILVDCSGADGEEKTPEAAFTSKKSALLQLVDQRPVSKTIIFCNKVVYFVWTDSLVLISVASILALVSVFFHYWLSVQLFVQSISGKEILILQFWKITSALFLLCRSRFAEGLKMYLLGMTEVALNSLYFHTMPLFHKRHDLKACSNFWRRNPTRASFLSALTGLLKFLIAMSVRWTS